MTRGLAASTHRTYRSGVNRYYRSVTHIRSFPVSETPLFVTALAWQGTSPATKTYLAAVRHAHIMRGHRVPRQASSLPRLRLLQNGVRRERAITPCAGDSSLDHSNSATADIFILSPFGMTCLCCGLLRSPASLVSSTPGRSRFPQR